MQVTDHRFADLQTAKDYALAGMATITLQSLKTGRHYTYKVKQAKDAETHEPKPGLFFVNLLTEGNADEGQFTYLGMIRDGRFSLTKKSAMTGDSGPVAAFSYFWRLQSLNQDLAIMHAGKCCRCGRTLTEPESLRTGVGPECRGKMGLA